MVYCKPGNRVLALTCCIHEPSLFIRRHSTGVTLVELILCLCMLSVLVAFATPSMNALLERQRTLAATHTLIGHLATARTSAIMRKRPVVVCPATEDHLQCAAGTNWSKSYLVFLDPDGNQQPDHPEDILMVQQNPLGGTLQLYSTIGRPKVRYLPNGRSPGSNVTFSICNARGKLLAQVIVNNAGRARSTRPKHATVCPS